MRYEDILLTHKQEQKQFNKLIGEQLDKGDYVVLLPHNENIVIDYYKNKDKYSLRPSKIIGFVSTDNLNDNRGESKINIVLNAKVYDEKELKRRIRTVNYRPTTDNDDDNNQDNEEEQNNNDNE